MSKVVNGNENGTKELLQHAQKKAAPSAAALLSPSTFTENRVVFQTAEGVELQGVPVRMTRHTIVFDLYNPTVTPRFSEALDEFKIILQARTIYSGRAVIRNTVDAGTKIVCEATLNEAAWTDLDFATLAQPGDHLTKEFHAFFQDWQKFYKVSPEFKIVIADLQAFLHDLRLWLNQVELHLHSAPAADKTRLEKEAGRQIGKSTTPIITQMFENFEEACRRIDADLLGTHSAFAKRILHPLLLGSPFLHRTYHKPLGYAGDYEMVNMILRDPLEGDSLFAKIVNLWFWEQPPAEAHRNRIKYLVGALNKVTLQAMQSGKIAHILSIGCGPAIEVQRFVAQTPFADHAHFTLLDFNQTTLDYTKDILNKIKGRCARKTALKFVRKSVDGLLREGHRAGTVVQEKYDLVYCAGLFDYLTDTVCRRLNEAMYDMVKPGGLLVVTNVSDTNPRTPTMDHIMDWHLIYRSAGDLAKTRPVQISTRDCVVKADDTGVNIFMELQKSIHE